MVIYRMMASDHHIGKVITLKSASRHYDFFFTKVLDRGGLRANE
jgi:hypothetical protein